MKKLQFLKALIELMYELGPKDGDLEAIDLYENCERGFGDLSKYPEERETLQRYLSTLVIWVHPKYQSETRSDALKNLEVEELFELLYEGVLYCLTEGGELAKKLNRDNLPRSEENELLKIAIRKVSL